MDRIADLVQQLEPETPLPSQDVRARQRDALLRSMVLGDEERKRSRSWGSRHRNWFVAIVGAAAAVVVAAILVPRFSPSPPSSPSSSVVLTAITRTLANTGNDIEEVQSSIPGTPLSTTSWVDLSTGACRTDTLLNGQPSLSIFVERGNAVVINHDLREWWSRSTDGVACEPLTPQVIAHDLAVGHYTVDGNAIFDGQASLKLVSMSTSTGPHPATQLNTLWVNAATYLPIQSTSNGHLTERTIFSWLPRTPSNAAVLNVMVPTGFRQIAPPPPQRQSVG
jgi:hypothetical protein